jgi:hypothetical protein
MILGLVTEMENARVEIPTLSCLVLRWLSHLETSETSLEDVKQRGNAFSFLANLRSPPEMFLIIHFRSSGGRTTLLKHPCFLAE